MTTHSNDVDGLAVEFRSGRTFRMWKYGVGHSQLLFRATPDESNELCLDVLFEGVSAVRLASQYESIEISFSGAGEAREIFEISGLDEKWIDRSVALSLRSGKAVGLVLCSRATVLVGGSDLFGVAGGSDEWNVVWSSS